MPLKFQRPNILRLQDLLLKRNFVRHFRFQTPKLKLTRADCEHEINNFLPSCSSQSSAAVLSDVQQQQQQRCQHRVHVHNREQWPPEVLANFLADCFVRDDFVTEDEEAQLLDEIYPHMKRMRWESEHWDGQIQHYREREQMLDNWRPENQAIIRRIWHASFPAPFEPSPYVHILDLHQDGFINPHLDKSRYCGRVISGLSLLSTSVMRMRHKCDKMGQHCVADLLLTRRSLYRLGGLARFDFTHALLAAGESQFGAQIVPRERRIAIICREVPTKNDQQTD